MTNLDKSSAAAYGVRIVDARLRCSHAIPRAREWQLLSIDAINDTLARPLSQFERNLNAGIGEESIVPRGDLITRLPCHSLTFVDAVSDSDSATIMIEFRNDSDSDRAMQFEHPHALPPSLSQSLPLWVTEHGSSADPQQRYHRALTDANIFEVSPMIATIAAHSSTVVTIKYHSKLIGKHRLPIIFHIVDFHWMVLVLSGETLSAEQPKIDCKHFATVDSVDDPDYAIAASTVDRPVSVTHCHSTALSSVPVHLTVRQAPHQSIPLFNDTGFTLRYRIRKYNYSDSDSVWMVVDGEGVIEARSSVSVRVRFRPTQCREYTLVIGIDTSDANTDTDTDGDSNSHNVLIVRASGVHPTTMHTLTFPPVIAYPLTQSLHYANQLAMLSLDHLSMGALPLHSTKRMIVVLRSMTDLPLSFSFTTQCDSLLDIEPAKGKLTGGRSAVVSVSVSAGAQSLYLDTNIRCRLTVDTDADTSNDGSDGSDDDGDDNIVIASSAGNFPINHTYTLSKLSTHPHRFPQHRSITDKHRQRVGGRGTKGSMLPLSTLGVTQRTQNYQLKSSEALSLNDMETAFRYANMHTHSATTTTANNACDSDSGGGSEVLVLRVTGRIMDSVWLEHEYANTLPLLSPTQKSQSLEQFRSQFHYQHKLLATRSDTDTNTDSRDGSESAVRALLVDVVRQSLYSSAMNGTFQSLQTPTVTDIHQALAQILARTDTDTNTSGGDDSDIADFNRQSLRSLQDQRFTHDVIVEQMTKLINHDKIILVRNPPSDSAQPPVAVIEECKESMQVL